MPIEKCSKCGRERPSGIVDPSCSVGGYCSWVTCNLHAAWIGRPIARTKRENVKQAFEELVKVLKPFPTDSEKFFIAVGIDMLLDALEL